MTDKKERKPLTPEAIAEIQIKRAGRGYRHWIDFLPEVGKEMELEASAQKMFREKIDYYRNEIDELIKIIQRREEELKKKALQQWTQEEIDQAYFKATKK